jgi:heptosyltransferase-2
MAMTSPGLLPVTPRRLVVMQPLPGIGDMIWHLPHIRALARHAGGPVTLVAKPRSLADQIFAGEDTVRDIIWLDRNPGRPRGRHEDVLTFWHLTRALRAGRFDAAVLLHHSHTLAFTAWLAGIPMRQGYGVGTQRWFLNRPPYLPGSLLREHQFQRATRFLHAAGIAMEEAEPHFRIAAAARDAVRARLAAVPRPLVAIGIGSSERSRQWGVERLAELTQALLQAGWPTVALLGGPDDAGLLADIQSMSSGSASRILPVLGWHLSETAALLGDAAFYVGNNTGVMNLAASVGIRTYALFGTTPPFHHSRQIVPIVSPAGGPDDGMARVTLAAVLDAIARDRGALGPSPIVTTGAA